MTPLRKNQKRLPKIVQIRYVNITNNEQAISFFPTLSIRNACPACCTIMA